MLHRENCPPSRATRWPIAADSNNRAIVAARPRQWVHIIAYLSRRRINWLVVGGSWLVVDAGLWALGSGLWCLSSGADIQGAMKIRQGQMVRGFVALVIAACCCTLASGAQVQLPTVQSPIKDIGSIAITPDGRRVLFSGTDTTGVSGTWMKGVRTGVITPFKVSDQPDFRGGVFSPDGQWLAFFSQRDSTLRRVRVSGGSSTKICDVSSAGAMDWADNNTIVFIDAKRAPND